VNSFDVDSLGAEYVGPSGFGGTGVVDLCEWTSADALGVCPNASTWRVDCEGVDGGLFVCRDHAGG